MQVFKWILVVVLGYLFGSINGAVLTSKLLMKDDVRSHGSGNAGLTNFMRTYGGAMGLLVIAVDVLKVVIPCLIAKALLPEYGLGIEMVAGAACVVGHSYPIFSQFRGGKGILCGAALAGVVDWRILVIILAVFILTVAITKLVSLGSILAACAFAISFAVLHWGDWLTVIVAIVFSTFAIARHHANIGRLIKGTESKFSFHKK